MKITAATLMVAVDALAGSCAFVDNGAVFSFSLATRERVMRQLVAVLDNLPVEVTTPVVQLEVATPTVQPTGVDVDVGDSDA